MTSFNLIQCICIYIHTCIYGVLQNHECGFKRYHSRTDKHVDIFCPYTNLMWPSLLKVLLPHPPATPTLPHFPCVHTVHVYKACMWYRDGQPLSLTLLLHLLCAGLASIVHSSALLQQSWTGIQYVCTVLSDWLCVCVCVRVVCVVCVCCVHGAVWRQTNSTYHPITMH